MKTRTAGRNNIRRIVVGFGLIALLGGAALLPTANSQSRQTAATLSRQQVADVQETHGKNDPPPKGGKRAPGAVA